MSIENRRKFLKRLTMASFTVLDKPLSLAATGAPLKVGVVYVTPISDVGWTRQHEKGCLAMEAAFGERVMLTRIENVSQPLDAESVFRELATKGHHLIFGTSFSHAQPLLHVAAQRPDTVFESCAGLRTRDNLGTFEARYHEGTYLAGVAAAHKTTSRVLGFVGGFPLPAVVSAANAFLLGARCVDSSITCKLLWLNSWFDPGREREAAHALIALGADVLMSMTATPATVQVCEAAGVASIGYASDMSHYGPGTCITSLTLDWSSVYLNAVRHVLMHDWKTQSCWEGLAAGVVRMTPYRGGLGAAAIARVRDMQTQIAAGTIEPFTGPVRDQAGRLRVAKGQSLSNDGIRGMNWLVDGVKGELP